MLHAAAVKDADSAHRRHRPITLDVGRAMSADIPSQSSLVSVADHVEHLTDTAMGRCLSCAALFSFAQQSVILIRPMTGKTFCGTEIMQNGATKLCH